MSVSEFVVVVVGFRSFTIFYLYYHYSDLDKKKHVRVRDYNNSNKSSKSDIRMLSGFFFSKVQKFFGHIHTETEIV